MNATPMCKFCLLPSGHTGPHQVQRPAGASSDIQTLRDAARILGQHGQHAAATACTTVVSTLVVDQVLGADPQPAPGNRLERLTPRPGRIGGAV